ncbi:DNA-processing protein DprA [Phocaeicola sp.]
MEEELIYTLALTAAPGLGLIGKHRLIDNLGSAAEVFRKRKELLRLAPGTPPKLLAALDDASLLRRAEEEIEFAEKNRIRCLSLHHEDYPSRLRDCDDAPLVLFYRGNADLNALRVINMVGTRHATVYGQDICLRFLTDLTELCPDTLIVSGLAYGIDIHAHRAALQNHFNTIGVLAHGLDRIYPAQHRKTAIEMLEQGGLLTEFMSGTNPDRQNFVKRNRIVAGMSDATIVVESAAKGGALITAELAESYHRDCFAFPGRVNDELSIGCNNLIKTNRAALISSAEDFVNAMGWGDAGRKPKATVQRELFPELNEDEQRIVGLLRKRPDGLQINTLVVETDVPVNRMSALLFELEMKGVVRALAGGVFRLIG